ncbi:MAG: hypothetical protein ACJ8R9_33745 [Steroidobacteraceae bacterium]
MSTADLAAAGRRPDSVAGGDREPVSTEKEISATGREERSERQRQQERQSAGAPDEAERRAARRDVERDESSEDGDGSRDAQRESAEREVQADAGAAGFRAADSRDAVQKADAQGGNRWFSDKAGVSPSLDRPPADTEARSGEELEPLFTPEMAETYRSRWISIQSGFVDDPRRAVRSGDELVAQMMSNLAKTFTEERHRVEAQLDSTGEGSTEQLRVTLRRYRSFFERLLSL